VQGATEEMQLIMSLMVFKISNSFLLGAVFGGFVGL
jgi:hypothetical protein